MIKLYSFILIFLSIFAWGQDERWIQANISTEQKGLSKNNAPYIENLGQFDSRVQFKSSDGQGAIFIESDRFTFLRHEPSHVEHSPNECTHGHTHQKDSIKGHVWRLSFLNALSGESFTGKKKRETAYNYILGNDPSKWVKGANGYDKVIRKNMYSGIDISVYRSNNNFKYDCIVSAGADPNQIQIQYSGMDELFLQDGNLIIGTSIGAFKELSPVAYQIVNGQFVSVPCAFVLENNTISYFFPEGYDSDFELVIDPELVACTFLGGTDGTGGGACHDTDGNIYSIGLASSEDYPTDEGSFQMLLNVGGDMFIAKINPTGTDLIYGTYLGGTSNDSFESMRTNEAGELYIYGRTSSFDFPVSADAYATTGPEEGEVGITNRDIFLFRLSADGGDMLHSTFIGGSNEDLAFEFYFNQGDFVLDEEGNCIAVATVRSEDFPTTPGVHQGTYGGGMSDMVLFSLNEDFTELNWSTYLGSEFAETSNSLILDNENDIYVVGSTNGNSFASTGYIDSYQGGSHDAILLHIAGDGSSILNTTYWGSELKESGHLIDYVNETVYIMGKNEEGIPVETTADLFVESLGGIFLASFSPALNELNYATALGGIESIPNTFHVDSCGYVYLGAYNSYGSEDFPEQSPTLTDDAYLSENTNYYACVLSANAYELVYGTGFYAGHIDFGRGRLNPQTKDLTEGICNLGFLPTTDDAFAPTSEGFFSPAVFKMNLAVDYTFPSASFDADTIAGCAPLDVSFSNTSEGDAYEWDFDDGSPVSTEENPIHTFTEPGTYLVRLVATLGGACHSYNTDTSYLEITVASDDPPIASFDYDVNCATGEVNVTYTGEGGTPISFDMGDGTIITESEFDHTYTSAGSFIITLTAGLGVCAEQTTTSEEVLVGSAAVDLIYNSPTCFGFSDGSVTLELLGPGDEETIIEITDAAGELLNEGGSNTANTLSSGWYYYTVSLSDGCSASDSIELTDPPQMNGTLSITDPLCYGDETGHIVVDTVFNYQGGYDEITYLWAPDAVGASGLGGDSLWNLGVGEYTLTLNDDNGCSHVLNFEITEPSELVFSEFGHDPAFCRVFDYQNGNGQVFAAATGGVPDYTYVWKNLETLDESVNSTWGGLNPAEYEITVTDENGCILRDTILMDTVNPIAAFDVISSELNQDCQGTAPVSVTFVNQSEYFSNLNDPFTDTVFFWTLDHPNMQWVLSEDYFEQFDTTYLDGGTYDVCLIAQNKNGCKDTTCKPIVIYDELVFDIVNIFSPDGDGVNDEFTFIYRSDAVKDFSCIVVNRWGVVVAEFDEITDTWDGTNKNGTPVPDGVYFYTYAGQAENSEEFSGQGMVQIVSKKE